MQRTLREELLVEDDDDDDDNVTLRPPKGSTRWKGFLGLKKTHIGSKKKQTRMKGLCREWVTVNGLVLLMIGHPC